jgi:hypothetical protein
MKTITARVRHGNLDETLTATGQTLAAALFNLSSPYVPTMSDPGFDKVLSALFYHSQASFGWVDYSVELSSPTATALARAAASRAPAFSAASKTLHSGN